jgi:hypothetical protein
LLASQIKQSADISIWILTRGDGEPKVRVGVKMTHGCLLLPVWAEALAS